MTITFNSVVGSGTIYTGTIEFDGFAFTSDHFHLFDNKNNLAGGDGTWMGEEGGERGQPITMTRVGGGTFSLVDFWGGEFDPTATPAGFPNATNLDVLGTTATGTTVSAHFQLDGIVDGRFGLPDLQTFTLGSNFQNLVSVQFSGTYLGNSAAISLDNINVEPSVVPVPGALILFGSALLTLARRRRSIAI